MQGRLLCTITIAGIEHECSYSMKPTDDTSRSTHYGMHHSSVSWPSRSRYTPLVEHMANVLARYQTACARRLNRGHDKAIRFDIRLLECLTKLVLRNCMRERRFDDYDEIQQKIHAILHFPYRRATTSKFHALILFVGASMHSPNKKLRFS